MSVVTLVKLSQEDEVGSEECMNQPRIFRVKSEAYVVVARYGDGHPLVDFFEPG